MTALRTELFCIGSRVFFGRRPTIEIGRIDRDSVYENDEERDRVTIASSYLLVISRSSCSRQFRLSSTPARGQETNTVLLQLVDSSSDLVWFRVDDACP